MWRKERVIIMAIPAYYSLLQRGSSGPDVALVQTWLNGVRDASPLRDGAFGSTEQLPVLPEAPSVRELARHKP